MAVLMPLVLYFVQNVIHFVTYLLSITSAGQHDRSRPGAPTGFFCRGCNLWLPSPSLLSPPAPSSSLPFSSPFPPS